MSRYMPKKKKYHKPDENRSGNEKFCSGVWMQSVRTSVRLGCMSIILDTGANREVSRGATRSVPSAYCEQREERTMGRLGAFKYLP